MELQQIQGVIKDYDWGNTTFLPEFLGLPSSSSPMAEYWMGTHPAGDATLVESGEKLSVFLAHHADSYLGQAHLEQFGATLPFLYKILAIGKQLSIQCHPTVAQAKAGWAKEAPLRAREKNSGKWDYQDDNRKAEVIYALTPITAMCGFRPYREVMDLLSSLIPQSLEKYFSVADDLRSLFQTLYTLDKPTLDSVIAEYLASLKRRDDLPLATADGRYLESKGIVMACKESYPSDPGLFCPFLLNVLHLEKGEALFLEPDILHAYVLGNGIELMSASDNVLRGGLTHKKVDVPELLSILNCNGEHREKCPEEKLADGRIRVVTPTPEFALYQMTTGAYEIDQPTVELLLVTDGEAVVSVGEEQVTLHKGQCWLKAASVEQYRLTTTGAVYSATTGV